MHRHPKAQRLFLVLGGFFLTNALLAEFIGVKIFSLEKTLGLQPLDAEILQVEHLNLNLTAGVIVWPIVFVISDIINEYFGRRGVKLLSYLTMGLISYAFLVTLVAIQLTPADFWRLQPTPGANLDRELAFRAVFGQGLWIIIGSLVAFLLGQLLDVAVFHAVKNWTGDRWIWLRATGSTLVSQLVDSFVVLFIAFYLGAGWTLRSVLAISIVNYVYKSIMAIALTPLLYVLHAAIDAYLGKALAHELMDAAQAQPARLKAQIHTL